MPSRKGLDQSRTYNSAVCFLQRQIVKKYFEKEEERLEYFEKRQIKHEKEKKEMEAEQQRKKTVREETLIKGTFTRVIIVN